MPFFVKSKTKSIGPDGKKKRKSLVKQTSLQPVAKKPRRATHDEDEEITSDEETLGNIPIKKDFAAQIDREEEETATEKKNRLAVEFLNELRKQKAEEVDEDEVEEVVRQRLRNDVLEAAGNLQTTIADSLDLPEEISSKVCHHKHHRRTLTALVVSPDGNFIYTVSKDPSVVKWSITGERLGFLKKQKDEDSPTHVKHEKIILCLAISSDGKYLATGDDRGDIHVWTADLKYINSLKKHRQAVTGLAFQRGSQTLFSCSEDRMIFVWNLDLMAFVDNLGGHQSPITGIDSNMKESCISSGGRDQMVVLCLLQEEKQLRYISRQSSVDGVKLVNEKTFITFGQEGSVNLWNTAKKKPLYTMEPAHGMNRESGEANWITAVGTLVNTDLIASGSMDGFVRLWQITSETKRLNLVKKVPVHGVVNGLAFTPSGSHLIAAVGKEHRLGRWYHIQSAKNSIVIIPLNKKSL